MLKFNDYNNIPYRAKKRIASDPRNMKKENNSKTNRS